MGHNQNIQLGNFEGGQQRSHLYRYYFARGFVEPNDVVVDFGCFVAGTEVLTSNGYKDIKDITIGELVLTHKNRYKKVIKTYEREGSNLLKIKSLYGFEVICTDNHPFYSVLQDTVKCRHDKGQFCNTSDNGNCSTCKRKDPFIPKFIEAGQLKKNDFLTLIVPKRREKINVHPSIPKLLGYYLAEGSVVYSHKPKICGLRFSLNINEEIIKDEIVSLANSFGVTSISVYKRSNKNIIEVIVFGKKITEEILRLGGQHSDKKYILNEISNWDKENIRDLLIGWFLGDGHHGYYENTGERITGVTVSYELAKGIQHLLRILNISCGFHLDKEKNEENRKIGYRLSLFGGDIIELFNRKKDYVSNRRYRKNNNFLFIPIISVEKVKNDKVYNLTIEEDNTYIANGVVVHNCGYGYGSHMIAQKAKKVIGIDRDDNVIKYASANYRMPNSYYIQGNIDQMDQFPECDVIVCVECFEHLRYPEAFASKAMAASRKKIVITCPIVPTKHEDPTHLNDFTQSQVHEMFNTDSWSGIDSSLQGIYMLAAFIRKNG